MFPQRDDDAAPEFEVYRASLHPMTVHPPEAYPGILVVKVGPGWAYNCIVPKDGQTVTALGGEKVIAYRTPDGAVAEGFELRPGDRATRVRSGLPHHLAEWRIARAPRT